MKARTKDIHYHGKITLCKNIKQCFIYSDYVITTSKTVTNNKLAQIFETN